MIDGLGVAGDDFETMKCLGTIQPSLNISSALVGELEPNMPKLKSLDKSSKKHFVSNSIELVLFANQLNEKLSVSRVGDISIFGKKYLVTRKNTKLRKLSKKIKDEANNPSN